MNLEVWQGKELEVDFLDVWQNTGVSCLGWSGKGWLDDFTPHNIILFTVCQ
jgi:hypothetical protein